MIPTRIPIRLPALAALLLLLGACSPTYVLRAGYEQAKILNRRQPIARMIEDPATDSTTRAKLRLVLQAREYAARDLGLEVGRSYTTYARVDTDTLLHVLSAARKDAFEPHTWWFPIVGRVPYKGWFDRAPAEREREELERRGLDTYLRPASAFSTLGWFNDPLLSTLLRAPEVRLANTVIHEVTHNTFYAPGQARFNESFATFVGGRGAIDFFCGREDEGSTRCAQARGEWHDDLLFGEFLTRLLAALETLYAREDLSSAQKIEIREGIFEDALREFREELRPRFRVSTFASFEELPLNNATLVGRRLYYHRLDLFDRVLAAHGGDLRTTVEAIIAAARSHRDDPYAGVEALLPDDGTIGPPA
jgi:predicted aminopeptidase